ncbi:caspase-7 [Denticeps clupeoides]|uniref:Caspase 3, apoptosis-related cysteine peptidase-like n=1 Tax=Denticeps clupeoides TaxID=299321 RepID=A0AAY4E4U6_9TELE|nr:caspase-7-like [Denticeps clupeoides]
MTHWTKHKQRGDICNRAVIVSVEDFHPGVDLSKRKGVSKDTKRLHKVLTRLGFLVKIYSDPTADDMCDLFKKESETPVKNCFIGIISSHGEEGVVSGTDGKLVRLSQIFRLFGSPTMADVTKLFFVQACRGHELDNGVETDSVSVEEDGLWDYLSIPIDTAVMYATAPGYSAFMHPLGSVFLQTLCDLLEEEGGSNLELNRLMTRLNYQVAYNFQARGKTLAGKKEMPCFVTSLTKEVFPFRDCMQTVEDVSQKLSSMASLDVSHRQRKRSIS